MFEYIAKGRIYNLGKKLVICNGLKIVKSSDGFPNPLNIYIQKLSTINIISRVFRLSFDAILSLENGEVIVFFRKTLFVLDSQKCIKYIPLNHKVLSALKVGNSVFFGDYFGNNKREAVSVYEYKQYEVKKIWTFLPGEVRHVHNILRYDENLLILTGDYGHECGVFMLNKNSDFICVISMDGQMSRFVNGIVVDHTLITATDTHISQNYALKLDLQTGERLLCGKLPGPVFDIAHDGTKFFLTTVVEKSDVNTTNHVEFHVSEDGTEWELIEKWKKDFFPKRFHRFTQFNRVYLTSSNGEVYLSFLGLKGLNNKIFRLCR